MHCCAASRVSLKESSWSTVARSGCLPSLLTHCHAMALLLFAHACGLKLLSADCAANAT